MCGVSERAPRIDRLVIGGYLAVCLGTPAFGATVTWDGGGDGTSWTDSLNWDPNGEPGAMDDVVIDVGLFTIALSSDTTVQSLTLSTSTLNVNAGFTLMVTGVYGKTLPPQNGAPIRLIIPWKYGFKGIKSIVSIRFTQKQPLNTWRASIPGEYGFYANVNPEVDHPRWSQATERRIGEFRRRDTLMFNGYADEVASLYSGLDLRKNY